PDVRSVAPLHRRRTFDRITFAALRRAPPSSAATLSLRLALVGHQISDDALSLPDFNVLAIQKLLCFFDCGCVVRPLEFDRRPRDVTVLADDVESIFRHRTPPPDNKTSLKNNRRLGSSLGSVCRGRWR